MGIGEFSVPGDPCLVGGGDETGTSDTALINFQATRGAWPEPGLSLWFLIHVIFHAFHFIWANQCFHFSSSSPGTQSLSDLGLSVGAADDELVMSSSNLIVLIGIFILAILLFLVILDLICCFGFNAGLIRFCCGSNGAGSENEDVSNYCCCPCLGSSTRRSIRSGSSSIQKEDPEDHDHLNGHNHHNHLHHHHPPPHHHHVLNHPLAQAKGDAV